jgi:hypothetical protein
VSIAATAIDAIKSQQDVSCAAHPGVFGANQRIALHPNVASFFFNASGAKSFGGEIT